MKKWFVLILVMINTLTWAGCSVKSSAQGEMPVGESGANVPVEVVRDGEKRISDSCAANDFELELFADRMTYTSEEAIQIWATLEYVGTEDTVTIWHGLPYIVFSITDGVDFNVDGIVMTVLTSTELNKGEVYEFDYVKSGGFSADDPSAEFWEKFYQEEDLKLPVGTYTVTVRGAFSLSEDVVNTDSGLSCQLQIEVK